MFRRVSSSCSYVVPVLEETFRNNLISTDEEQLELITQWTLQAANRTRHAGTHALDFVDLRRLQWGTKVHWSACALSTALLFVCPCLIRNVVLHGDRIVRLCAAQFHGEASQPCKRWLWEPLARVSILVGMEGTFASIERQFTKPDIGASGSSAELRTVVWLLPRRSEVRVSPFSVTVVNKNIFCIQQTNHRTGDWENFAYIMTACGSAGQKGFLFCH